MRAVGGGSIVNISSVAGLEGFGGHAAYGSSKWGVRGLTKIAALELGPDRIRVNSIHPGAIDTAMIAGFARPGVDRGAAYPMGRIGQPEDVAALALFLASDDSSYVTGAEVTVDGGLYAGPTFTRHVGRVRSGGLAGSARAATIARRVAGRDVERGGAALGPGDEQSTLVEAEQDRCRGSGLVLGPPVSEQAAGRARPASR